MRGRALGMALVGLVLAGCKDEPRVIPVEPGQGGAAAAGLGPIAEMTSDIDEPLLTGEMVRRGRIEGQIRYIAPESITVDDDQGRRFFVELSTFTEVITSAGEPASALAFRIGTPVQLWFVNDNEDYVATRIQLQAPPASR